MPKKKPSARAALWQWAMQTHWAVKAGLPILLFIGAMGSAAATWDKFGWWKPASIQYVDGQIAPANARLLDLQIEQAEGKRDAVDESIFKWTDAMGKEVDGDKKAVYRDRIRELEGTKRKLDAQINTLNRARGR